MNTKIKLALLAGKDQEKGFSTVLAMGMGLISIAVGMTMIARGQSSQISANSQVNTAKATAIADVGISRTQALLLAMPDLARKNYGDWPNYAEEQDNAYVKQCGGNSTVTITKRLESITDSDQTKVSNGKFQIVDYTYNQAQKTGTLTIKAETDNGAKTQIKTVFPIKDLNEVGTQPPGLWVNSFTDPTGNKGIGDTQQKVNADVVTRDCTTDGFSITQNFPTGSNWQVRPQPLIGFPDLPALPSHIKEVTNLAICSSSAAYPSTEEQGLLAEWFDRMNRFLISPAMAQTTETITVYIDDPNQTSFSLTLKNALVKTKNVPSNVGIVAGSGNNKNIITYTVPSKFTSKTTHTFQYTDSSSSKATYYNVSITFVPPNILDETKDFNKSLTLPTKNETIDVIGNGIYQAGTVIYKVNNMVINTTANAISNVDTTYGKVAVNGGKELTYTVKDSYLNSTTVLKESFTYTLKEGNTYYIGKINMTINPPVVGASAQNYNATIQLPATSSTIATLPSNSSPTISVQPTKGTASINGSILTYTVSSNNTATQVAITDQFKYKITVNGSTTEGVVNLNILPANEQEIVDIVIVPGTTEYSVATNNNIESFDSSSNQKVSLAKVGNKNIKYTAGNKFDGIKEKQTDSFNYTYKSGNTTKTATVMINIYPPSTNVSDTSQGSSVNGQKVSYVLPGGCTGENYYNPDTNTYDFLVSSLDADDITIKLPNTIPGGKTEAPKAVRIFVQNNIDLRGNTGISAQANALQIYGSNGLGMYGNKAVNYALPGDSTKYTVTEVLTRGGANIYAFLFAPAAKAGVAGGGNGGGFYGSMWVNNWAGAPFGSSSNKIVIDPPAGTDWTLVPEELQNILTVLMGGGINQAKSYEREAFK